MLAAVEDGYEMVDEDFGVTLVDDEAQEHEHTSLSFFSTPMTKQEKWEKRNPSIHATVYDPSGQSFELRHLKNNPTKLVFWDSIDNKMGYARAKKNSTYVINDTVCTLSRPTAITGLTA